MHRGRGRTRLGEPRRPRCGLRGPLRWQIRPGYLRRRRTLRRRRREAVHQLAHSVRFGARAPFGQGRGRGDSGHRGRRDGLQRVHPGAAVRGPHRDGHDLRRRGFHGPQIREAVRPLGWVRDRRDNPARDRHGAIRSGCPDCPARSRPSSHARAGPPNPFLRPSWSSAASSRSCRTPRPRGSVPGGRASRIPGNPAAPRT